jgi:hypothetical protein
MYMVMDKEKPGIGSKRGLNLAVVRPTTVQLTAVSEWLHMIGHNLLHKPALTGNLCMPCIKILNLVQGERMHRVRSDLDARIYSC